MRGRAIVLVAAASLLRLSKSECVEEIERSKTHMRNQENDIADLKKRISSLKEKLREFDSQNKTLQNNLSYYKDQFSQSVTQVSDKDEEIINQQEEFAKVKQSFVDETTKTQRQSRAMEELERELKLAKDACDRFKHQVGHCEENIHNLKHKLTEKQKEGVIQDDMIRHLEADLKTSDERYDDAMNQVWFLFCNDDKRVGNLRDLDIDTLESKGHWATLDELLHVVTYHLPRYETVTKVCKERPNKATPSDLSFATKFVAVYLFIKVKGSRPMTYQYLTVDMIEAAKGNEGFIDQKKFKTTARFGFDSLYLSDTSMHVLDAYISYIRPLLKPTCDYVLVTKKGGQHSKIGQLMSKMVFDATGKFIHPTRYRQIVETASHEQLTSSEQEMITEDQKHSSVVAKVHYQKRRSRDVATKAHACLKKLQGEKGSQLDGDVCSRLSDSTNTSPEKDLQSNDRKDSNESDEKLDPPCASNVTNRKKKLLLFTLEEDECLKAGITQHGYGQWSVILRDTRYKFQRGRTANSLLNRASRRFATSNKEH
ncbi:hypothetical protein QZH41_000093 [Actinostola sp. cb2023]|nr:hypothetical protein QZH41_000093 [Actinostola sp. cb2023]